MEKKTVQYNKQCSLNFNWMKTTHPMETGTGSRTYRKMPQKTNQTRTLLLSTKHTAVVEAAWNSDSIGTTEGWTLDLADVPTWKLCKIDQGTWGQQQKEIETRLGLTLSPCWQWQLHSIDRLIEQTYNQWPFETSNPTPNKKSCGSLNVAVNGRS